MSPDHRHGRAKADPPMTVECGRVVGVDREIVSDTSGSTSTSNQGYVSGSVSTSHHRTETARVALFGPDESYRNFRVGGQPLFEKGNIGARIMGRRQTVVSVHNFTSNETRYIYDAEMALPFLNVFAWLGIALVTLSLAVYGLGHATDSATAGSWLFSIVTGGSAVALYLWGKKTYDDFKARVHSETERLLAETARAYESEIAKSKDEVRKIRDGVSA